MKLALLFTFLSLALTSLSDFIPKFGGGQIKSRGGYIAIVGLMQTLCFLWLPMGLGNRPGPTFMLCLLAGMLSVIANILLIESMRLLTASLSSTIYRLNMVYVFLGAWLFLGESVTAYQWAGILLALISVIIFTEYRKGSGSTMGLGVAMVVAASILRSAMGLVFKHAIECGASANTLSMVTALCWLAGGPIYALLKERSMDWVKDKATWGYGVSAGIIVAGIVYCMAHSLRYGAASILLPIAQMSFVLTFFLEAIFLHEKITARKVTALIGCILAVVLLVGGRQ